MIREEIEKNIKIELLKNRVEEINKNLVGKKEKFTLEEIKEDNTFKYNLKTVNKYSDNILAVSGFIDKIELLGYIRGLELGMRLSNSK